LVFVVKYRKQAFLKPFIVEAIKNKFEDISKDFDVKIISQETDKDHLHLLIEAKPTLDIPKYINILKGHSSRYIRKEFQKDLKSILWGMLSGPLVTI